MLNSSANADADKIESIHTGEVLMEELTESLGTTEQTCRIEFTRHQTYPNSITDELNDEPRQ